MTAARPNQRRGGAVLGSPIAHSLSPRLHQAAYDALGLTDWSYRAVECDRAALAGTLRGLEDEGLAGASLTMPLKRAVLPLLTRVERLAADVGAVNTVCFGGVAGEWWGANTDVPGFVAALKRAGVARPRHAVVLGAGATAASAVAALADMRVSSVAVLARSPQRAVEVVEVATRFGVSVEVEPWETAPGRLDADLVISTVPAGGADWLVGQLPRRVGVLFDVVYAPWPTPFAADWAAVGGRVVGGLSLLVEQAAEQVRLMTGKVAPVEAMYAAVDI